MGSWPYEGLPAWVFTSRELPVIEGADIRFASGPVAPHHAEMTAAAGDRGVWLVGGGHLAAQFAAEGLIDELILTLVPVVLGSGLPTFAGRLAEPLTLTGVRPYANGMVELRYARQVGIPGHVTRRSLTSAGTSISRFRILPVGPFGSSSMNQSFRGYL